MSAPSGNVTFLLKYKQEGIKVQKNGTCLYCGAELSKLPQRYKYCSKSCSNKYKLRIRKPDVQTKLWQHEQSVFENAMELYWSGAESASIARQFDIPVGTVYSWVHDFGNQKQRIEPLKNQLRLAQSADEWLTALRESTFRDVDSPPESPVFLVCGYLRGQSVDRLATVIFEKLKYSPTNGKVYAFCNKSRNTITTLAWKEPVFNINKYIKVSGTFIWPDENLGATIEITKPEFEHLVSLKKNEKSFKMLEFTRVL